MMMISIGHDQRGKVCEFPLSPARLPSVDGRLNDVDLGKDCPRRTVRSDGSSRLKSRVIMTISLAKKVL